MIVLEAGLDPITWLVIANVALSALALAMASKDQNPDSPLRNKSKPTTLSDRGSYIPYVIGRRRIGSVFGWAGSRRVEERKTSTSSKGGGRVYASTDVYYESGVHWLCVGPAWRISQIWRNGRPLLAHPMTAASHPSGTIVTLVHGTFQIYWGEENQPINTWLGATDFRGAERVGVTSRWPGVCYIVWREINLHSQPVWPQLEYDIEVRAHDDQLFAEDYGNIDGWMVGDPVLTSNVWNIIAVSVGGPSNPNTTWFEVQGAGSPAKSLRRYFHPGRHIQISGNSYAGGAAALLTVHKSEYRASGRTRVYIQQPISTANNSGTLTLYEKLVPNDGVNPAQMIDKLLCAEWPKGLGLHPQHVATSLDFTKFSDIEALFDDEDLAGSIIVKDGEEAGPILGRIMQDLGMFLSWNPIEGLWWFWPIRAQTTLPNIDTSAIVEHPEVKVAHGALNRSDRVTYHFPDQARRFSDSTIHLAVDGLTTERASPKAKSVQLFTAVTYAAGDSIAERRILEDVNDGATFELTAGRETRVMMPGQVFTVDGVQPRLLLVEKQVDPNRNSVKLKALSDFYGLAPSTFSSEQGGGLDIDDETVAEPDEEVYATASTTGGGGGAGGGGGGDGGPGAAGAAGLVGPDGGASGAAGGWSPGVIVNRIRANENASDALVYVSADGSTYHLAGRAPNHHAGGELIDSITDLEQGPAFGQRFTIEGPDITSVLDLSNNAASWQAGRQLMMINDEIFFLESITVNEDGTANINNAIRARLNTTPFFHPTGSAVFIFPIENMMVITDPIIEQTDTLYVKVLPVFQVDGESPLELDEVEAVEVDVSNLHGLYLFRDDTGALHHSPDAKNWELVPKRAEFVDPATATTEELIVSLQNSGVIRSTPS